jgi:putative flippase GtrA
MGRAIKQAAGAGLAGFLGTVVDVAVLAALVEHGAGVAPSTLAGSLAGAGVSFVTSKYVAFRDRSSVRLGQVASFGAVALATALLTAAAMQLVAVGLGVPYLLAKGLCAVAVFFVWSFPAQRRFVFRPSPA